MLSRVADSIYWMSRYLERAEHAARLLRVRLDTLVEEGDEAAERSWRRLSGALVGQAPASGSSAIEHTLALAFDRTNRSSMLGAMRAARDNARQVREQISSGLWEALNRQYLELKDLDFEGIWAGHPSAFFGRIVDGLLLLRSIAHSTMQHGEGWRFLELGRYIERASLLSRLIEAYFADMPAEAPQGLSAGYFDWITLLKQCAAFEAYCKAYTARFEPAKIAEFLIFSDEFPHAVRFAVDGVRTALGGIGEGSSPQRRANVDRLAGRLAADLAYGRIEDLMTSRIVPFVREIERQCDDVHVALHEAFIAYGVDAAMSA
jgi:uncharacterized alpha-E superfamily protein